MAASFLSRMSQREKRLAFITLAMVGLVVGFTAVRQATAQLEALNEQIESRVTALENDRLKASLAREVDARYRKRAGRYAEVARSADIRTEMQNELLRLSLYRMPPADEPNPSLEGTKIVSFPTIPEGDLEELGEGYMEYSIRLLRINNVRIANLAQFLQRIEDSPKLLRVDKLEIDRANPETSTVNARLRVTRTLLEQLPSVAEDAPGEAADRAPEEAEAAGSEVPEEGTAK
jgi:hypothetical protein